MDPVVGGAITAVGSILKGITNGGTRRKVAAGVLRADEENIKVAAQTIREGMSPLAGVRDQLEKMAEEGATIDQSGVRLLVAMLDVGIAAERKLRAADAVMLEGVAARSDAVSDALTKED